jgi:predicted O-methyltransferase YrrM
MGTPVQLEKLVEQACDGAPSVWTALPFLAHDYLRGARMGRYLWEARRIPGWTRGDEARALARAAYGLGEGAVIVEIGAFLGRSTVLLAGSRKLRGSGIVHAVDPFDASGDSFSSPVYRSIQELRKAPLRRAFEENIERAGVARWVRIHQGTGVEIAGRWSTQVDMLFLDGDHSYAGARPTYDSWIPFLSPGGLIAVHNSSQRKYQKDHDGSMRLVAESIHPPEFSRVHCVGSTTFAFKAANRQKT